MIIDYICKHCNERFFGEEQEKFYNHLATHKEAWDDLNKELVKYNYISKYISFSGQKMFNLQQNCHQFFAILFNNKEPQFSFKLRKADKLLKLYGDYLENLNQGIIKRKIIGSGFWSFYSELEVLDAIKNVFGNMPDVGEDISSDVDFLLKDLRISFEVKTPMQAKEDLAVFVAKGDNQKQIRLRKQKWSDCISVLLVDGTYNYPLIISEDLLERTITNYSNIEWDCCIVFSSFYGGINQGQCIVFNPTRKLDKELEEKLRKMLKFLKESNIKKIGEF